MRSCEATRVTPDFRILLLFLLCFRSHEERAKNNDAFALGVLSELLTCSFDKAVMVTCCHGSVCVATGGLLQDLDAKMYRLSTMTYNRPRLRDSFQFPLHRFAPKSLVQYASAKAACWLCLKSVPFA